MDNKDQENIQRQRELFKAFRAVKVFPKAFLSRDDDFYNEVACMHQCREHPNIADLYHFFDEAPNRFMLLQEICPFGDLANVTENQEMAKDIEDEFQLVYILR